MRRMLLTTAVVLLHAVLLHAQNPVPLYPANYKVMVENDRVRVLDFRLRKGDTERLHSLPAHVLYVLERHKAMPYLRASFERRKDAGWQTEIIRWYRVGEERGGEQAALR